MNDIVQMSKGGAKFYPQTHVQAVLGLQDSLVGTNLLTNSNFSSGLDHWTINLGTKSDGKAVVTTDSDGDTCVHITGTGQYCGIYCSPVPFNQNQVTTGSILAKGIGTINTVGLGGRPASNFGTILTKSYSKIGSKVQASSNTNAFAAYFDSVNGVVDVFIKFAKLEIGSYATDYSLNPQEIATNDGVQTAITNALSDVKTQVDNSAVGTNLYTDTKGFYNTTLWFDSVWWKKTSDTYKGLAVMQTTANWGGPGQHIQVKKGDVLTYSVYARYTNGTGTSNIFWALNNSIDGSYSSSTTNPVSNIVTITDSWQRVSGTAVATIDGYLRPRLERTGTNTSTLQIAGIKVEKGSVATDWCPNPAEIATNNDVQTAIASALGKVATINVISQADYDKLADKSGVYFIEG